MTDSGMPVSLGRASRLVLYLVKWTDAFVELWRIMYKGAHNVYSDMINVHRVIMRNEECRYRPLTRSLDAENIHVYTFWRKEAGVAY